MVDKHDKFYKTRSKKYKRYKFHSKSTLVKGVKPNFFDLVKKYSDTKFTALDLGCGSGELTLKLSPLFGKVIGVDMFKDYIQTAKQDTPKNGVSVIEFLVADAKQLSFKDETFDVVYSSRGPLSADMGFMSESHRVLKKGGFLIEETIGEEDKLELKKIFSRGQGYPYSDTKLGRVKKMLGKLGAELTFSKYYKFHQSYGSLDTVINLLERAPIIPDFDKSKDMQILKTIEKKLNTEEGIVLSSHRLHWVGQKH